ncbi:MAG TPA: acyl-CoA dehydrogenase family protein [Acidimicrobiales bacterium]|nr:acyl-CoA dehydrogenase family protein [Acidimicrobiales bacterium]
MIDWSDIDSVVGLNWYRLDPDLQARVRRDAPPEDVEWSERTLDAFGDLVGGTIARAADIVDAHPPELVRYDRWANEVNELAHHPAMLEAKAALWRAGYPSGFAPQARERKRPVPGVVLGGSSYLLSQADTGMVCSLGMTTGVAGLVEAYAPPDVRDELLAGLRAADVADAVDGSMFLTERDGGSDLGRTVHCTARDLGDGRVAITGEKWFCSNVDGAAIVLLARPEGAPDGPAGLGLYLVPRVTDDGSPNHYSVRRLKQKLGTKSVPTGEVEFRGALGYALRGTPTDGGGDGGRRSGEGGGTVAADASDAGGLNRMMEMVNGSRFGVALMGLGIARRCVAEATAWAHHRQAKGRALVDLPLVREQLVDLLAELEAATALGFECTAASKASDGARLRRILVPAAKVRLCRFGVEAASYAIELHGGNGYCEDWGLTRQLRDAQCHPIWEGSENICVLDVLRAIRRDGSHEALLGRIDAALAAARGGAPGWVQEGVEAVTGSRERLAARIDGLAGLEPDAAEAVSGRLCDLLNRTTSAALLLEQAGEGGELAVHKGLVALRFVRRQLVHGRAWDDGIAAAAGRELLAFAELDEATAAKAAA